ncbi:SCO family protein [Parasediminibacterium sp. JCM 36343]|uniref:SCO family protein n=1 Tax=Parasediminibacterium sp. JCM 36343 TaxID=3374279 RepID=UPI00397E2822
MNKKAFLSLCIAILIPVLCYMVLKTASESAVNMPRHFLLDSVVESVKDGKRINDTVWHKTANITLINQLGDTVSLYDKPGKITVIDFFFTRCGSICPRLTRNMAKLQRSFINGGDIRQKIDTSVVQFVSFSIDADRDSVPVLKDYADRFGVNHDNWWMLTGNQKKISKFAFEELKVDQFSGTPIDSDFVHTNRFVVLDKDYIVRGYYNGLDSLAVGQLARDIGLLMLEKDKHAKSAVFAEIISLKWMWAIVITAVVFFVVYMLKRQKING